MDGFMIHKRKKPTDDIGFSFFFKEKSHAAYLNSKYLKTEQAVNSKRQSSFCLHFRQIFPFFFNGVLFIPIEKRED